MKGKKRDLPPGMRDMSVRVQESKDGSFLKGNGRMMQHLAKKVNGIETRWSSFENPKAQKGSGGWENHGAKGHPCDHLYAGKSVTLMEHEGAGEIRRIWMTIGDRSPAALRSLTLRCYWDGCEKPAVEVPLGDFMCSGQRGVRFESECFASPEGRSFNCYLPMPFRTGAKITLTNESDLDMERLFYDVDYLIKDQPDEELLYFHSWFHRSDPVALEQDHVILPRVSDQGRFLGASFLVNAPAHYGDTWWGEGEVKIYLDGDGELPTLVGTGTEDYIGTAWGQGEYAGRYQGCLIADSQQRCWSFYRFHICDPVYFYRDCKVTIQDIGGGSWQTVKKLYEAGVPMTLVTCDGGIQKGYQHLYGKSLEEWPQDGWINFYRCDDMATVAYFYLDSPASSLPDIQPPKDRLAGLQPLERPKEKPIVLVAQPNE